MPSVERLVAVQAIAAFLAHQSEQEADYILKAAGSAQVTPGGWDRRDQGERRDQILRLLVNETDSVLESLLQMLPKLEQRPTDLPEATTETHNAPSEDDAVRTASSQLEESSPAKNRGAAGPDRQAVMVIYGHDSQANRAMFDWLRTLGLHPQEWSQLVESTGQANPYIGDVLTHAFQSVQAVVAFFTPDEHVRGRDTLRGTSKTWRFQARPNVLIEAGMALITHPDRTVFVTLGLPELPSDLAGRHYVRLDGTPGPLNDLANRLEKAGCDVNRRGTQWTDPKIFPRRDKIASQPRQI